MSLSNDTFDSEDIYKCEKIYTKKVFFDKYFSIVHSSFNFLLTNPNFFVDIGDIYTEGTVSQNVVLSLSFYFM